MTTVFSYGGGTNSAGMLVGLMEKGEKPDIILFADPGGERPKTYAHIEIMKDWCKKNGFPEINICSEKNTLEQDCLDRKALPGIAYGFKSCSEHYKTRPQKRWLKAQGIKDVTFWLGIDACEQHRAKYEDNRYPLIEWGWCRKECTDAIDRANLPQPGKSACFFCPSSKPNEILQLKREYPDLYIRAINLEVNAELTQVKGLGRNFAWKEVGDYDESQVDMFGHSIESPCGCYDG